MNRTLLLISLAFALVSHVCAKPDLQTRFMTPPESARPWVYWYFMDGNMTREGLTADLEAMKTAGIGGTIFLEVGIGIPRGPVEFMSPEWQSLFKHAVAEADRLGIEIAVGTGPGWCGSGGPWIKPDLSMQHTVASETVTNGPVRFDAVLPRPQPRTPFFGMATLTPGLKAQWQTFYKDVAVLAYPTPQGQARLADADEKALYYRAPYSSQPGVKPYLPAPADHAVIPAEQCVATERVLDLTSKLDASGRLVWQVPPGNWTIMRFGRTLTGQTTRPAPEPGLGLESDKFAAAAIDAHLAAFTDKLLAAAGKKRRPGRGLTALHFDSWEMSSQNGSAAFLAEFRKRRGYDPLRYLPALTGRVVGSNEVSERFLWDVRQTAQELVIENHVGRIRDYAHKNGMYFSIEPYDLNPCSDLELGSVADVPMCEFWSKGYGFPSEFSCFEAVSIAHTRGRPVVGAESFTALPGEDWQQHPASMKAQGDWALCCGINRFTFHRFQHQPRLDQWPGMTMGPYGVCWDRTQTWWGMAGAYHTYLSRCQELLRQGLPVADILYLVPEGAPHVFHPPSSATEGELPDRRGYNFDGCAPGALLERASVKKGRIVFPDGMSYRVLVLPRVDTMTPSLLKKIVQLADDGATVIGAPPRKSPSLSGFPKCDLEIAKLAERLRKKVLAADDKADEPLAGGNPLAQAKWIWYPEGQPGSAAPVCSRYFSRAFIVEGASKIESARIFMTADNAFELSVNGNSVGRGNNFHQVKSFDVSTLLTPGANVLRIAVDNGGESPNPAGLIGSLIVRFANKRTQTVVTDHDWNCALTAQGELRAAMELGGFDMAPWKLREPAPPLPELYPGFDATAQVLAGAGVPPDFASDGSVRFSHRCDGDTDLYFIANREEATRDVTCRFRVTGKRPEWWNPNTGECRELPQFEERAGVTSVPLRLETLESGFVVFRQAGSPAERRKSSVGSRNIQNLRTVLELAGPWEVAFDPKWLGSEVGGQKSEVGAYTFENLQDWAQRPEPGIKYYSGTAVYRTSFDVADSRLATPDAAFFLDLGNVKNMASVTLNGKALGTVWCSPWRVRIPDGVLHERGNALEVTVANLWINRLIGDAGLPQEKRLTQTTRNPYKPDAPLHSSGLLGPVTIQRSEASGER